MRASRDALFYFDKVAGHLHLTGINEAENQFARISRLRK